MSAFLLFLAVGGDADSRSAATLETVWVVQRPLQAFTAEIQVERHGLQAHGRVVVAGDGAVFVEHLPIEQARQVRRSLLAIHPHVPAGWNRTRAAGPEVRWSQDGLPCQLRLLSLEEPSLPTVIRVTLVRHQKLER